jgi:hypothetical protein
MKYNYTQEILDSIVEGYKTGASVQELSVTHNIPVRSIIAKLSNLGVYKKKHYVSKTGEVPVKKEQLLETIADLLGEDLEKIESLEKCTKSTLKLLINHLS